MTAESIATRWHRPWTMTRVLFAMAGTVTLASILLAALMSPWWLLLTAFVGVSQWSFAVAGDCPASVVLRRIGVRGDCATPTRPK
jgi:hypothetical protein